MYMCRLPEEKVPYVNSIGEQYRARQLLTQLPPQDSDMNHCHHDMSEEEKKELKQFQAHRRRDALGRGNVRVIPESVEGVTGICQQVRVPRMQYVFLRLETLGAKRRKHPTLTVCESNDFF